MSPTKSTPAGQEPDQAATADSTTQPEPQAPRSGGRSRIVAVVVAIVAVNLLLLFIAAAVLLRADGHQQIEAGVEQEVGEIELYSASALDPATGADFDSVEQFIDSYLERQVPESAELIFGGLNGSTTYNAVVGTQAPLLDWIDLATRTRITQPGSSGTTTSAEYGVISWSSTEITVQSDAGESTGHLTVAWFHEPSERQVRRDITTLGVLALGSLITSSAIAWAVSGRLAGPGREPEGPSAE